MVCCVDVIWYVVWYDTLLSVSFNMLLYAWLGMLIDSTLLWDMFLMRRFICCWSELGCYVIACHCFGSSCFSMKSCGGYYFRTHRVP